jgi:hypothetical protein
MTAISFRKYHMINILHRFEEHGGTLDRQVEEYFRKNKQLGSKDRKDIADSVFGMVKWKGLLDGLLHRINDNNTPITWEHRYDTWRQLQNEEIPSSTLNQLELHNQVSCPSTFTSFISSILTTL